MMMIIIIMIIIIIGTSGTISKSFRKYRSNITGQHEIKQPQKTATLNTAHILRKVLMYNRTIRNNRMHYLLSIYFSN
jgi:hypothetical protein